MARGGYRPGSSRKPKLREPAAGIIDTETPLAYLLSVMRDPTADPARRDRCAQVAAPFLHARAPGTPSSYNYVPKKDEAAKRARWAGFGTSWWDLLHSESEREEREAELARDPELRRWLEAGVQRTADADEARRPAPAVAPAPEAKDKAKPTDRWAEYLGHDEPPTDWTNPDTGESDLAFNPRNYKFPEPPDDE